MEKLTTAQIHKEIKRVREHIETCSYGKQELFELAELGRELLKREG